MMVDHVLEALNEKQNFVYKIMIVKVYVTGMMIFEINRKKKKKVCRKNNKKWKKTKQIFVMEKSLNFKHHH